MIGRFWHHAVAKAQTTYDSHIRRGAWRLQWPGLLAFFRDPRKHAEWLATGRLRRMFQGHVAQRWSKSVAEASGHAQDEMLVLTLTSSKYRTDYSLQADQVRSRARQVRAVCCVCSHEGGGADYIVKTICNDHACQVHSDVCSAGYTCERDSCKTCTAYKANRQTAAQAPGTSEHNFRHEISNIQSM